MARTGEWKLARMETCKLPEDVASGLFSVMEQMAGARYAPVLYCGTQLVNGMNHMVICQQTLVTAEAEEGLVEVILHHERDAKPGEGWSILCIKKIL